MVVRPQLSLHVVPMAKLGSGERKHDFREVARGYTPDEAAEEAQRCLQCPRRPCVDGCPVGIAIPDFILALRQGDMPQAVKVLKQSN
ncbi:MAG: dihydropyrimidine dehydrogenase, partial [Chloroflexota bacterium]